MTPRPISAPPVLTAKKQLDIHEALRSTLRAWLVSRDSAIWLLVAGENAESGGPVLENYNFQQFTKDLEAPLDRMNSLRQIAYDFAAQISESSAEAVLREALDSLLKEETAMFSLHVDNLPTSF